MLKQNITKICAVLLLAFGSAASAQKAISVLDLIIDRTEYKGQTLTLRCDHFYPLTETSLSCRDTKSRLHIYARVQGFNKKQLRWLFENCFSSVNDSSPNCANVLLVGRWDGDYIQEADASELDN
jgi:predicted porin